jgi:hypothetical protein
MKYLSILLVFAAFAIPARAAMDDVTYTLSSITTNQSSAAYTVRGEVEGVILTMPANKTGTVTVATASGVKLFEVADLTSANNGYIPLRYPAKTSANATIVNLTGQAALANSATNIVYTKIGIAELVTTTIAPAANTTGTNTFRVKLVINK